MYADILRPARGPCGCQVDKIATGDKQYKQGNRTKNINILYVAVRLKFTHQVGVQVDVPDRGNIVIEYISLCSKLFHARDVHELFSRWKTVFVHIFIEMGC